MGGHDERRLVGRVAQRLEARILGVERVIALVNADGESLADRDVGQQQRVGVHQDGLALRMRLARDGRRTQQAVGEAFLHDPAAMGALLPPVYS